MDDRQLPDRVIESESIRPARLQRDMNEEAGRVLSLMEAEGLGSAASAVADDDLAGRVDRYEALADGLAQAAAVIAAFGTADGHRILAQVVERMAEVTDARADGGWSCLARYPAL